MFGIFYLLPRINWKIDLSEIDSSRVVSDEIITL